MNQGLSWSGFLKAFGGDQFTYWHPAATISTMADISVFGPNPGAHHLMSVFFHAGAAIFLFWGLVLMTGAIWPGFFAAALFAVHPINAEAVCWLAQRKTVLTGFFGAGAVAAYAFYAQKPGGWRYALFLAASVLCMMSKPSAALLPLALLALDYWPLGRLDLSQKTPVASKFSAVSPGKLILEKAPLILFCVLLVAMTIITGRRYGGLSLAGDSSLFFRLENFTVACIKYFGKLIWFRGPTVFHPFPVSLPAWQVASSFLVLAAGAGLILKKAGTAPHFAVCAIWFLLFLAPSSGIIQAANFPALADRYLYLSAMGVFIALTWSLHEFSTNKPALRKALAALSTAILAAFFFMTWNQTGYWVNSQVLFSRVVKIEPENYIAHNNLGVTLAARGNFSEAARHYEKSADLMQRYKREDLLVRPYFNLGNLLMEAGQSARAEKWFRKALEINPGFEQVHNNLGIALLGMNRVREAIECFEEALRLNPNFPDARYNLEDLAAKQPEAPL